MRSAYFIGLALGLAVACGDEEKGSDDTSTSSSDGGVNANGETNTGETNSNNSGDVPVCSPRPQAGTSCDASEGPCQVAGSPCGSLFTCEAGEWDEMLQCPQVQECPVEPPEADSACTLDSPVGGDRVCLYDACGKVQANCDGVSWTLQRTPASTACVTLCNDLCTRLIECGITWADTCVQDCSDAYGCPGETPGQDTAICEGQADANADLACAELCANVTDNSDGQSFGDGCEGI